MDERVSHPPKEEFFFLSCIIFSARMQTR
jgi:hypothetical protein